jgi:peptide-methionine (S)-S-oxide reductase
LRHRLLGVNIVVGVLLLCGGCDSAVKESAVAMADRRGEAMMAERTTEKATFAAGCFWGVEAAFRNIDGIISTQVGYTGGKSENPTYQEVCTDRTGHAEAVEITYDASKVSYEDLLKVFWEIHDPTQLNRQGPDMGTQYRSAIFYHNAEQEAEARKSKQGMEQSGRYDRKIVTGILPVTRFYRAEEYHQQYYEKRGGGGCPIR